MLCCAPILLGFLAPVLILGTLAWGGGGGPVWTRTGPALANTFVLGGVTACLTVALAFCAVYGLHRQSAIAPYILRLCALGYAIPGAVLSVGLLIPLAWFDNRLADMIAHWTGKDPGLLLTGGMAVLVLAYMVRFFAIGIGAVETSLAALSPNLPHAARTLGATQARVIWQVLRPLMKGALLSAMVLIFVDTVKELPATLLLRPFNFDTLATLTYNHASVEDLAGAAIPSLMIIVVSLIAVIILAHLNRE